jgi:hypothetical protein
VETARNRNFQTRTYKQEIQLIQVARIWQASRGASIDAGAFGLAARWARRWVHWGIHWCEHCNGSWIGWFILWLLVLEGHYGWRNLIRTRGHPLLVARLWTENVLTFQCLNCMSNISSTRVMNRALWQTFKKSLGKSRIVNLGTKWWVLELVVTAKFRGGNLTRILRIISSSSS